MGARVLAQSFKPPFGLIYVKKRTVTLEGKNRKKERKTRTVKK